MKARWVIAINTGLFSHSTHLMKCFSLLLFSTRLQKQTNHLHQQWPYCFHQTALCVHNESLYTTLINNTTAIFLSMEK